MTNYEKVQQLLQTRNLTNIDLAIALAEASGLDFAKPYHKLWNWLKAYGLMNSISQQAFDSTAQLIHQLLRIKEIYLGRQLLKI